MEMTFHIYKTSHLQPYKSQNYQIFLKGNVSTGFRHFFVLDQMSFTREAHVANFLSSHNEEFRTMLFSYDSGSDTRKISLYRSVSGLCHFSTSP